MINVSSTIAIGDILTLVTIIVVATTGLIQIRQLYKQSRLSSFAEYTKRYQDILLNLPSNYFAETFSFDGVDDASREQIHRFTRVYFDLCSEEYFLHKEHYIPDKIWEEWEKGILSNFGYEHTQSQWKSVSGAEDLYGEFKKYINDRIAG